MRPHRNRGLFSNYYLDALLPREEEFKIPVSEVEGVFAKVKALWDRKKFEALNEDQLRKHFLDNVLHCLGWVVDVNTPVPTGERCDYALFLNNEDLKTAQKEKKECYFERAACIVEAKRFGRSLDRKLKTESDPFEVQNPSLQISRYLWLTGVKWGILTDGKYWRLYERESSKRLDLFYEVDLEELIESGTPEDFRYFYLLVRKDAFPEFIEKVYKGSIDYAEAVGEELKGNIYQALQILAQGFRKTPGTNLSEEHLQEIHDSALILLYRLLFILYAEYRDLLPLNGNKLYTETYSLDAFKKEVATSLDKNEPIAASTFRYWNKLKELFEIINKGNQELGVPPYNGGLFDPEKHTFLEKHRIGDLYVAKALDLISRSKDKAYIDYGSLEIRHLGSIYEGLLEYKLKVADQDLISIKEKGKEIFVSLEEAKNQKKKIREEEKIPCGEVYLVTDKGERKATGSYYTPDYIVKYIVENTLGPLVEEKGKKVCAKVEELKEKVKVSRGSSREAYEKELRKAEGSLIDEILSLKVLDPAMGSGHFLVEATDFLARELLKALSGEPLEEHSKDRAIREPSAAYELKDSDEEDIRWARREVVERCIFGVDLNPMAVELAKLSLWLYTVAKNRPLNFLDHHLRCGNSLIGAKIEDLASFPELKKKKMESRYVQRGLFESIFKEKVNILLGAFSQIERLPSETVEQIREKEKLYQEFRKIVSRFQDVADVWASVYFENEATWGNYQKLQERLRSSEEEWERLSEEPWFKKAKATADEKRFFHWELEFPEVFFEGHQRKDNPGFDAVVGNPPYGAVFDSNEKWWLRTHFSTSSYNLDSFSFFVENSATNVPCLRFGMIIPNTWCSIDDGFPLRKLLLHNKTIELIVDTGNVFEGAEITTLLLLFQNKFPPKNHAIEIRRVNYNSTLENRLMEIGLGRWAMSFAIPQQEIIADPKAIINFFVNPEERNLLSFLKSKSISLGNILNVARGARPYGQNEGNPPQTKEVIENRAFTGFLKIDNTWKPLLTAACLDRYNVEWQGMWIKYGPWLAVQGEDSFFFSNRLLIQRIIQKTPLRFLASYCEEPFINNTDIFNAINPRQGYSLPFLLASISSGLFPWIVAKENVNLLREAYPKINVNNLEQLPIRRISFVTPKTNRTHLVEEAKVHYEKYLETGKPAPVLHFIESRLTKEHAPDPELVKKHNADPLNKDWQIPEGALWEQSDVVHDVLAYLAEQMLEINKEKQAEIKGFLKWLETQLKIRSDAEGNTGIEVLTGKTQIKNYLGDYQKGEEHLPFEEFWKVLEKNKNRIQANLKSRELFENISAEYEKSLSKLLPLKDRLRKTDWLIDQIVYKLYGLTEEEVKIIEGHRENCRAD